MSHALDCHIAHSNHGPTLFPTVQTSQSYFRGSIHFRFSLWLLLVLRGEKTRSPDCARRHLDSQNTTHSNNYNTIYWLLKRTKSNRLYLYLMSCLCVAPLPLRKNCRATAWRMIVFTKVHRLGCLLRERISLATLSFYNVISKSLHTRTFCPWRKQKKKSSSLDLATDSNPRKQAILKPFWLCLRISWDHFSSGCVSLVVWTYLLAVLHQMCVCVWIALQSASTMCAEPNRIRTLCGTHTYTVAPFHTTDG